MPDFDYRTTRFKGRKAMGGLLLGHPTDHDEFGRTPFERDVDRIKYTREVRRLKDVTQVARSRESYLYHDRLSHSLKVAQVGRRVAELLLRRAILNNIFNHDLPPTDLGRSRTLRAGEGIESIDPNLRVQLNPDVVEAACFAHDMGHPPFGHLCEKELDRLVFEKTSPEYIYEKHQPDDIDQELHENGIEPPGIRFEGNAQSFRILTRLASHHNTISGLGVTRAVLSGVVKYPWMRGGWPSGKEGKFACYKTEQRAFEFVQEELTAKDTTLEAEIMDFADDLTYAIHDITDFYKVGFIPIDSLLREASDSKESGTAELSGFNNYLAEQTDINISKRRPKELFSDLAFAAETIAPEMFTPYQGKDTDENALGAFTSYLIEYFLSANDETNPERLDIKRDGNNKYHLERDDTAKIDIDILQKLTHYYVISDSSLVAQQTGQKNLISELFESLYKETMKSNLDQSAIPEPFVTRLKQTHTDVGVFRNISERRARIVADFISSMTEPQAVMMHRRLRGLSPGSLQNEIFR